MKPMHTPNETARKTQTAVVKWLSLPSVTAPLRRFRRLTISRARLIEVSDAAGRLVSRHASEDFLGQLRQRLYQKYYNEIAAPLGWHGQ